MSQLKEYLSERIASRSDMISQWCYMEHGPDVLAVSFDAVDTISPSCGYPIDYDELLKNNHLLLKSDLNAEAVNPVQETGTSRIVPYKKHLMIRRLNKIRRLFLCANLKREN